MKKKHVKSENEWVDPDEAPEWTDEMFDRAEIAEGGRIIRPASGTVVRGRGRPPSDNPKRQLTLRLDPEIIEHFKAGGPGWQSRINDVLKEAVRAGR